MSTSGNENDRRATRSAFAGILQRRCPRCREGPVFRSAWVMNEDCPVCGLDFDRGEPGYFTGAMYASYGLVIPLVALLTLIEYIILRDWSLLSLVVLASAICVPLVPWIWQLSRALWIYFDRYFDPDTSPDGRDDSAG
jgi:uncharacterized protein (DUF983 family)